MDLATYLQLQRQAYPASAGAVGAQSGPSVGPNPYRHQPRYDEVLAKLLARGKAMAGSAAEAATFGLKPDMFVNERQMYPDAAAKGSAVGMVATPIGKAGAMVGNAARSVKDAVLASPKLAALLLAGGASTAGAGTAAALTRNQKRRLEEEERRSEIEAKKKEAEIKAAADAEARRIKAASDAEIERADAASKRAQDAEKSSSSQEEYDRQVAESEQSFKREMARDRRFSETDIGQAMNRHPGVAPTLAGILLGLVTRGKLGPGKSALGKLGKEYVAPVLMGATGGATMANLPLIGDAFFTESYNPEKAAFAARARDLPPTHPRRQEWADYAASLPDQNPIRRQAQEELFGPNMGERIGMGAVEGGLGAILGSEVIGIGGRMAGALKNARNAAKGLPAPKTPHWVIQKQNGQGGRFGKLTP